MGVNGESRHRPLDASCQAFRGNADAAARPVGGVSTFHICLEARFGIAVAAESDRRPFHCVEAPIAAMRRPGYGRRLGRSARFRWADIWEGSLMVPPVPARIPTTGQAKTGPFADLMVLVCDQGRRYVHQGPGLGRPAVPGRSTAPGRQDCERGLPVMLGRQ